MARTSFPELSERGESCQGPFKIFVPQKQHYLWHVGGMPPLGKSLGIEVAGEEAFAQLKKKNLH